jgi:nicotinamide-nucleotide amidase
MNKDANTSIILNIQEILLSRNEKISVAESLTSGMLQANFAQVSGISQCFEGGITAYSLQAKVKHLGVDEIYASQVNCVSDIVAMEMAKCSNLLFDTQVSISTTGYAQPYEPEGIESPVAHICVAYKGSYSNKVINLPATVHKADVRDEMRMHVTHEALKLALNVLQTL